MLGAALKTGRKGQETATAVSDNVKMGEGRGLGVRKQTRSVGSPRQRGRAAPATPLQLPQMRMRITPCTARAGLPAERRAAAETREGGRSALPRFFGGEDFTLLQR